MKILTLPVNKAAFDMLATSMSETRKNEEYRAIIPHWESRLIFSGFYLHPMTGAIEVEKGQWHSVQEFDIVKFTKGYGHKVPSVVREWKGLTIGKPNPLWVPKGFLDLDKDYFRIELGEIIN